MTTRVRARAAILAVLLLLGESAHAADRYDPRFRFRTISTPRFDIHFHQGEDAIARRLARIAEEVAARVDRGLGAANGRVHVILVDQTDLSNGWASPAPYNVIEITAAAPSGDSTIGNTDDWLRLVFSHEYTHIVHLDKAHGWIGGLRRVFGRNPLLYPNLFLPQWQIEGLATYNESQLTGEGRVPAGDFRMLVDRAAAAGRFEPLDRASGGLVDWPAGQAQYAYGAYFHQYLAQRFGADSITRLSDDTASQVPYLGSPSFKRVFGRSLGTLWKEFEAETRERSRRDDNLGTRLTRHGFSVGAPVFSASGRLFYAIANPHGFPALMELRLDGRDSPAGPRQVTTKYLGGHLTTTGDAVVFDQLEDVSNVALQGDLYTVRQDGGRVRRLTRGARAADPDVSPDGRTIVCTTQGADRRSLATLALPAAGQIARPALLLSEPSTDFGSPRWSPDGRSIVAERRRLGGPSEIVVVDAATATARTIVSSPDARNVSPVWTPDGGTVLFASDRGFAPFAIYAADVATGALRLLHGTGAAQAPALSPDGRTLVYAGYTVEGYDLFSLPLAYAAWTDVPASPLPGIAAASPPPAADAASGSTPYRPGRTLLPQFWMPVIESDSGEIGAGASTAAADALGRHSYGAAVTWAASRLRPDWSAGYAYDRWRPTLFAGVSDDTDPFRTGTVRTRELNVGALFPIRRVRWAQSVLTAFNGSAEAFDCPTCAPAIATVVDRRSIRLGWSFDNAKSYGYSISRESGGSIRVTAESTLRALGSDGDAGAITFDVRLYRRVVPRHAVIAARVAMATASGSERIRRTFSAGGAGPQPAAFGFGTDAIGLLRGFDSDALTGDHAVDGNLDYRFPILRLQHGMGTLPFFVRTIHAAIFADAGQAWSGGWQWADLRQSFGAELSLDTVLGYTLPLTFAGGAAWLDDPVGSRRGVVAFGRVGRAF